MRTSTLLFILTFVVLILLSFPEESHEIIFVLTHGKVSKLRKELNRKKADRKKRRSKARKNRNRRKRKQSERRKLKELKRWLVRFSKKVRAVWCVDIRIYNITKQIINSVL